MKSLLSGIAATQQYELRNNQLLNIKYFKYK